MRGMQFAAPPETLCNSKPLHVWPQMASAKRGPEFRFLTGPSADAAICRYPAACSNDRQNSAHTASKSVDRRTISRIVPWGCGDTGRGNIIQSDEERD